jgi:hypothetical protein
MSIQKTGFEEISWEAEFSTMRWAARSPVRGDPGPAVSHVPCKRESLHRGYF